MSDTIQQMPVWAMILIQLVTLVMGGGAVWAYLTRRRETDAERVARYEGRLDARLEAVERDRDKLSEIVRDLDKRLGLALAELEDLSDQLWVSRWREDRLVELLRLHKIPIPPELLATPRPPLRPAPPQAAEEGTS